DRAYILVTSVAILLIWTYNVYGVLTMASRAFALYYALQALIAVGTAWHQLPSRARTLRLIFFPLMALILFGVAAFAIPAH
ncbi:MAG: hypothetical protein J7M34_00995, partial [Anaerolineae bacterium]|nr:hypothetical protein [Anaerolineae bacterium]